MNDKRLDTDQARDMLKRIEVLRNMRQEELKSVIKLFRETLYEVDCLRKDMKSIQKETDYQLRNAGVFPQRMQTLQSDLKQAEESILLVRRFIWLNHGCPISSLYGDDGEMQCSGSQHKPLDFKRLPIREILDELKRTNIDNIPAPGGGDNREG